MENTSNKAAFTQCSHCNGQGTKSRGLTDKARKAYRAAVAAFEKSGGTGTPPERPKAHLYDCTYCSGTGIVPAENFPEPDAQHYPHVAIIGAGIGGVALAVACLHRGIPFTLFERDAHFGTRSQGYGLTMQQAGKTLKGLGITNAEGGVVSTRHLVHTTDGSVIGEWGFRKWMPQGKTAKRSNMHIARQALRQALLEQLGSDNRVQWNHQLTGFTENDKGIQLDFMADGEAKTVSADLAVGADGIRSAVRRLLIGDELTPLRYLDCIVMLGICPLAALGNLESPLLDGATVFQTANGNERIYMMPYSDDAVMWQLSFPMLEEDAKALSAQGPAALKAEACRRTQWHHPIPQIMAATPVENISGYPVYDRALLSAEVLVQSNRVTLIGDAAHPMSPFKGQGANQALIDALSLARQITKGCYNGNWRQSNLRESMLNDFEAAMLTRSAVKVEGSAAAAQFLHSDVVLREGDSPRGSCVKDNYKN